MPIILNDLTKEINDKVNIKTYSPKFFDEILTGSGKKIGLINEASNPINIPKDFNTLNSHVTMKKRKYVNGDTEIQFIPLYALNEKAWKEMYMIHADTKNFVKIAEDSKNNSVVYMDMVPHTITLETISNKFGAKTTKSKKLVVCYQTFIYMECDNNSNEFYLKDTGLPHTNNENNYFTRFTSNPLDTLTNIADSFNRMGYTVDDKAIYEFIQNYSLYDGLCEKSRIWQESIHEELDQYFENLANKMQYWTESELENPCRILHDIQSYNVPLDLYRDIYKSITKHFSPEVATILCKQNLNLLLSDTLNNLDKNKNNLTTFTPNQNATIDPKFSDEQKDAITTNEPLVMVQSVAGSGKSSVVLARIKYMVDAGVDPKDITVLSFTNAAANNIMSKNPGVNAYTIAKMIHEIYSLNYPKHELSSIDTVINSLDIYYSHDDLVKEFKSKLYSIIRNDSDSFTKMNNFIEENFDKVMEILNTIEQTTLELEIIIAYQKIEDLDEPDEIKSKFLIIDEVQDNSVFEFIYALKYCDKNKESLFIVGRHYCPL